MTALCRRVYTRACTSAELLIVPGEPSAGAYARWLRFSCRLVCFPPTPHTCSAKYNAVLRFSDPKNCFCRHHLLPLFIPDVLLLLLSLLCIRTAGKKKKKQQKKNNFSVNTIGKYIIGNVFRLYPIFPSARARDFLSGVPVPMRILLHVL